MTVYQNMEYLLLRNQKTRKRVGSLFQTKTPDPFDLLYVDQADYAYNGTDRMVKLDYLVPDVRREMFNTTTNTDYDAYDRFGRTVRQQWDKYNTSAGVRDQVDYTYDYAGNRLTRDIPSSLYATNDKDQAYTYDNLQRLKTYDAGTLSGTSISGLAATGQTWFLDQLGNWTYYQQFVDTGVVLAQERAHNDVNEIDTNNDHSDGPSDAITRDTGPNWADPAYDAAGNMTTMPQPLAPTSSYTVKYDAWNRLVEVKDGSTVVQTNEFDGLNRRIQKVVGSDTYDYYYNNQWQVLEIRKNGDTDPWKQYAYHPDYVDAIAVQFYDANTDGDLIDTNEGAHYYLQDANFNVTAITDNAGTVVERYAYTPYGEATFLDASFVALSTQESDIDNEYLYTGRRLDPETGLQLNRNRFYAAGLGRWGSRDPIRYFGNRFNLYEYVSGQPNTWLDPSGLVAIDCRCNKSVGPFPGAGFYYITVECEGLGTNCCANACGPDGSDDWDIHDPNKPPYTNPFPERPEPDPNVQVGVSPLLECLSPCKGGSGKFKIYKIFCKSKKAAKDAARNRGKGPPIKHPSDPGQPPHYHPVDDGGNKIPGPHYYYPDSQR